MKLVLIFIYLFDEKEGGGRMEIDLFFGLFWFGVMIRGNWNLIVT